MGLYGMEVLWSMLRVRAGTVHKIRSDRSILTATFMSLPASRTSERQEPSPRCVTPLPCWLEGGLLYWDQIADNGLSSGARSWVSVS